jgi:hypothetical protein
VSLELDAQQRTVMELVESHGFQPWEVWVEYIAVAGNASEKAVADYIFGWGDLPRLERDLLDEGLQSLVEKEWDDQLRGFVQQVACTDTGLEDR